MALNIDGLVDYIHEDEGRPLLMKSLFGSRTADLIMSEGEVMTGVKYSEKIGILATDAIFQNGEGCTRTSSGTTTLTQRQVTVGEIAVVEDICVKTLNKKYLSKKMAKGSSGIDIPFEKEFLDLKSGTIAEQVEIAIWQGDTNSLDANLSRFDGLIKLIDAATGEVIANAAAYITGGAIGAGTGITVANVKAVVGSMWLALPARLQGKSDLRVFCGWDTFQKYVSAYTDLNLYNFAPKGSEVSAEEGVIIIPGTNYKLTAVHGLDGTNRLFALRMSNLFLATDLENEEEKVDLIPDQFKDYLRFIVQFKYGVNVAFPDEIVSFKLA